MNTPKCTPLLAAGRYPQKKLRSLRFDGDELIVEMQGHNFEYARLTFSDVIGFRVLDERDLCEFWNTYSEPNGWLYEVHEGGWFELEKKRPQFDCIGYGPSLREFFFVDDKCISVLTTEEPILEDLGQHPQPNLITR